MKRYRCVTKDGECFELLQNLEGVYLCPVCGSPEHDEPPYDENGLASFAMCSCGFEFGYDDSNLATEEACEGVSANWDRWRIKVIEKNKHTNVALTKLQENFAGIGITLGFDLLPIKGSRKEGEE